MKKYFSYLLVSVLSVLLVLIFSNNIVAQENLQDVVYLKNGSVLHGKITEIKVNESITLKSNCNDVWVIIQADIDKIEKEKVPKTLITNDKIDSYIKKGIYSNLNVGFLFGGNMESPFPPISLLFVTGYQLSSGFAVGAGLGLDILEDTYMPVVVDLRYTFKNTRYSPFLFIQGGYAISLGNSDRNNYDYNYSYDLTSKGGLIINPGIGFKFNLNEKNALSFAIGYKYMEVQQSYYDYNGQKIDRTIKYNRISLSFAYHF